MVTICEKCSGVALGFHSDPRVFPSPDNLLFFEVLRCFDAAYSTTTFLRSVSGYVQASSASELDDPLHRGNTATFGFLSRLSSLVGPFWDLGDFLGIPFVLFPCPLKLGLWTGLFVCSFAWSLILAGCM